MKFSQVQFHGLAAGLAVEAVALSLCAARSHGPLPILGTACLLSTLTWSLRQLVGHYLIEKSLSSWAIATGLAIALLVAVVMVTDVTVVTRRNVLVALGGVVLVVVCASATVKGSDPHDPPKRIQLERNVSTARVSGRQVLLVCASLAVIVFAIALSVTSAGPADSTRPTQLWYSVTGVDPNGGHTLLVGVTNETSSGQQFTLVTLLSGGQATTRRISLRDAASETVTILVPNGQSMVANLFQGDLTTASGVSNPTPYREVSYRPGSLPDE